MTLKSDVSDQSDLSDKMGAPVFALTGCAVASHVIPRGVFFFAGWYGSGERVTAGYNTTRLTYSAVYLRICRLPEGQGGERPKPTFRPKLLTLFFEFYGPEKDAAGAEEHKGKYTHISILRINQLSVDFFGRKKIHDSADNIAENRNQNIGSEV